MGRAAHGTTKHMIHIEKKVNTRRLEWIDAACFQSLTETSKSVIFLT